MPCFVSLPALGQPPGRLAQEGAASKDEERKEHLASNWEAPSLMSSASWFISRLWREDSLHAVVGEQRGEAKPRGDSDANDDQSRLNDEQRAAIVGR